MATTGFLLAGLSGFFWTIVYISLIRTGIKDKTYGMPFVALALNIAWEFLYTYEGFLYSPENIQTWVNLVWSGFDIVIIYIFFKYGHKEFTRFANKKYFIPWTTLVLFMAFIIQYGFLKQFGVATSPNVEASKAFINPSLGAWYSAFTQNLIMSILFIQLLLTRQNSKGQSMTIAVAKWIGTLIPTILFGILLENQLVLILGMFCSVFDLIYIWLLSQYNKEGLKLKSI